MKKMTLRDVDVRGKRVLMRVDFNVPLNDDGTIRNDKRIKSALPSINYVRENGGKLILMSHLGRPKDYIKKGDTEGLKLLKMDRVAERLSELINAPVKKLDKVVGPEVEEAVNNMKPGDVILLENTRFEPGEEKNDAELSQKLAKLGDIYVSDAFGSVHRAHSSTEGVAHYLPMAVAGFLLEKEIEYFSKILTNPDRPLVAILGGKKVNDKIKVIDNLLNLVDVMLIGGGMAYTFLKALGYEIGDSILDQEGVELAKSAMEKAKQRGVPLLLPEDLVVANKFSADAETKVVPSTGIEPGWMGMDIGPKTIEKYCGEISKAKMVVWNGPVGVFEMQSFAKGSKALAECLANSNVVSVIGGGDTATAIEEFGLEEKMSHVSTGGGASLEMLEGKILPGIAVLKDKE
ncbi:MAG: phosphoglycerate kinase [Candidatus Hydrogenedentes bacterium]|nr:phosphoglycerate kinase [Candidatus Hydrogenedentota bacterium]